MIINGIKSCCLYWNWIYEETINVVSCKIYLLNICIKWLSSGAAWVMDGDLSINYLLLLKEFALSISFKSVYVSQYNSKPN